MLAGIPSPPIEWSHFSIGPLTIHWYAIIILIGIVLATLWTNARLTKRGGEPWVVIDVALWAVLFGLVGARFWHVFTHPSDYFYEGANPWAILFIWEGGNAILGALIGGGIGVWIACRRLGIRFWSFADALAPGLLLAQAVGRLGNYVNNELFGGPTDLPWGLQIEPSNPAFPAGLPSDTLFHPTFLYEMLWNLLGVVVIVLVERRLSRGWGTTLAMYFIWYGIGRTFIESIRIDPSEFILGMRANAFFAMCLAILGLVLLIVQLVRHPEPDPGVYVEGRGPRTGEVETTSPTETKSETDVETEPETAPEPDPEPETTSEKTPESKTDTDAAP